MSDIDIQQAAQVITGGVVHQPNLTIHVNGQSMPLSSIEERALRDFLVGLNSAERRRLFLANFPQAIRWACWLGGTFYIAGMPIEAFGKLDPEMIRVAMMVGWLVAVYVTTEGKFGQKRRRNLRVADHLADSIAAIEAELDRRQAMRPRSFLQRFQDAFDTLKP